MTYLTNDEHNTDWLDALMQDARHVQMVLQQVEACGLKACEAIQQNQPRRALEQIALMGEGLQLVRKLLGVN